MKEIDGGAKALPYSQNSKAAAYGPQGIRKTRKRYFKENIL